MGIYIFKTLWAAGAGFWPSVLHFKGINREEKRTRTKNLERGLNPSVGKARQEQDQQQQQESNKNKRKATTTRQTIKTHEKYLNSIIIQKRNTKASETKQPKKRKTRGLQNKRNK